MSLPNRFYLRIVLAAVCALPLRSQLPPNPATKSDSREETCVVSGMIVGMTDNAPLKGATVHLRSGEDREHTIAVRSGADGRFELKNVPAGQYHMNVSRNGYFTVEYGQNKPGDPGAMFSLRPGEHKTDLLFKLGHAGVITGRIFDEDGEPMPNVMVMALRNGYENGKRELQPAAESESNDLGEFRLYGLSPGRYVISAENTTWNHVVGDLEFSGETKSSGEKGYTKIYYPSALDPGQASTFVVKAGEEIPAVDILMKEITVYRIRGRLVNTVTKQGYRPSFVEAFRRNQRNNWISLGSNKQPKQDGSFEIAEVAPGEYTVIGMIFDEGKRYSGQIDIDVTSADVDGVALVIGPGTTILGRINWVGKPSLSGNDLSIYLESDVNRFGSGGYAHPDESWQFTLKEVPDGIYKVGMNGLSKDCYIKEIRFGENVLPDTEMRVKGAGGNLEVTVSSEGAEIDGGVVNKDDLPASGVWVVAIPEENKRKYLRLYKSSLTDQYGHFELHGLAPGKYKLFSWEGIESNAWEDQDFLKEYENKGETLEVQDGQKKSMQLKVIQARETDTKTE